MAKKTRVYLDTSAFISFRVQSDPYHPLFRKLFSDPPEMVTSSLVIAEGHTWFLRRYDIVRALEFLTFIDSLKGLTVAPIGKKEIEKARSFLKKFSDQRITLADACGLWIMDENRISLCFSTDHHLTLTGKKLIIYDN